MKYQNVLSIIDKESEQFDSVITKTEKAMLSAAVNAIKKLDVDASGNIKTTTSNIKLLASIRTKLAAVASNKDFMNGVKSLAVAMNDLYKAQVQYYSTAFPLKTLSDKAKSKHQALQRIAIDNVTHGLSQGAIDASVIDPLNKMLLRAVTSGSKYADLIDEFHKQLETSNETTSALAKYAKTYATTAMTQLAGENNRLFTEDLGAEWFQYVGSVIETSRQFCELLTEKEYIHKSEIKGILNGRIEIDGKVHECEMNAKTGLPKGLIEGTTEDNFQVNVGGWNCRHQLIPIAAEMVPANIRAKFDKGMQEKLAKQKEEEEKSKEQLSQQDVEIEKALGVSKEAPMSFEDANECKGNPHYVRGSFSGYTINCQSCVVANELRRRGYNVEAAMNTKHKDNMPYKLSYKTEDAWVNPIVEKIKMPFSSGDNWKVAQAIERFYRNKITDKSIEFVPVNTQSEGIYTPIGRYHLRFYWKGNNGGHIITFEKMATGEYRFYDPQTGKLFDFSNSFMVDFGETIDIYQVDNLLFNLEYASVVAKANTTKPSKIKYAKKQNGWAKVVGNGQADILITIERANRTFASGGFIRTNANRLMKANINRNERAKFNKELRMAEKYAEHGSQVEFLEEISGVSSYDAIVDGRKVDFKSLSSGNNIIRHAKDAIRKQGTVVNGVCGVNPARRNRIYPCFAR